MDCESVVIWHLDGLVEFLLINQFCARRFHHSHYAVFAYRQLDLLVTVFWSRLRHQLLLHYVLLRMVSLLVSGLACTN